LDVPLCVGKDATAVVMTASAEVAQLAKMEMRNFRSFGSANFLSEWKRGRDK
jgi:hypothetical protein